MWSSVSIPGQPKVFIMNSMADQELSDRLYTSLSRSGLKMAATTNDFNCLLLFVAELPQLSPSSFLLALTTHEQAHLVTSPNIPPIMIAPTTPTTQRQIGLFYLKFFTELNLHCPDAITGKMAWFAFSKAKELLRRRRYETQFAIRC